MLFGECFRNDRNNMTSISKRILVVDDEEPILRVCERILAAEGFEVVTAKSGDEAVSELEKSEFAVVFTDLSMPGMGGKELLKHIRENRGSTCVNIFTGSGTVEGAVECMRLGACDYIAKPFSINEMAA